MGHPGCNPVTAYKLWGDTVPEVSVKPDVNYEWSCLEIQNQKVVLNADHSPLSGAWDQ
jgi:hypothetical protein